MRIHQYGRGCIPYRRERFHLLKGRNNSVHPQISQINTDKNTSKCGLSFPCVLCIPWFNFLTGGVTGRIKPQFVSTHQPGIVPEP